MIKRILVGLAGTDYTPVAVQTALDLAKEHQAALTGVTIFDAEKLRLVGSVPIGASGAANQLREQRIAEVRERIEKVINQFNTACDTAGVDHNVLREEREEQCNYLMSQSRYHDLTVLGLRGVFSFQDEHNESDCTTLLLTLLTSGVRPLLAVPKEPFTVKRAMIAYSGSPESAKTMKRYVQLHPFGMTPLRIVTFEHSASRANNLLSQAAAYCEAHGYEVETAHIDEKPTKALLSVADDSDADIIVLGNSSRSILLQKVLGETVAHAIHNSTKPLFLCQ